MNSREEAVACEQEGGFKFVFDAVARPGFLLGDVLSCLCLSLGSSARGSFPLRIWLVNLKMERPLSIKLFEHALEMGWNAAVLDVISCFWI